MSLPIILTIPVSSHLVSPNKNRKREYVRAAICKRGVTEQVKDLGRYSSRCKFHKMEYHYIVNSVGRVLNKGRTLIYVDWKHKSYKHTLPKGWKWKRDSLGLKLAQTGTDIDYHPSVVELRTKTTQYLISLARQNYLTRQFCNFDLALKNLTKHNMPMSDIYVKREDSYMAGNCKVGTENFILEHGLGKYVTADKLPLTHHTKAAICQAIKRNLEDLDNGYCRIK